jgi:hypothetical protein
MIEGGSDRMGDASAVKTAGVSRRPSIRPKPVTPPRSAAPLHQTGTWTLPPVRTPAPRTVVAKRPVLVLVEQDESTRDVASMLSPGVEGIAWWRQPRAVALVVASVLVAGFATTAIVWTASARRDAAEGTEAVGTTTLASASLASPVAPRAPPVLVAPSVGQPAILEVDVNRLPSAPSRVASGAPR